MNATHMTFTLWKAALREDCEHENKLLAFDAMGDCALSLFYERGVEPTVQSILNDVSLDAPRNATKERRPGK